jgi:hypothetical protein
MVSRDGARQYAREELHHRRQDVGALRKLLGSLKGGRTVPAPTGARPVEEGFEKDSRLVRAFKILQKNDRTNVLCQDVTPPGRHTTLARFSATLRDRCDFRFGKE